MTAQELQEQLVRTEATVRLLQDELAETNRGLIALALELEERLDLRDLQLKTAHTALERSNANLAATTATVRLLQEELSDTNRGLVALTLELEQRVDARTAELQQLNQELEQRVQVRTAELRQANDNLRNFTHTAAHDLRAPLRALRGFADVLAEDHAAQLDPGGCSLLQRIGHSAEHMLHLLDDLLEYSRIGEREIELGPVNLDRAVEEALDLLEAEIRSKKAVITVNGPLPTVIGHGATVALVINNLLSNALKFTRPGVAPMVRVYAESVPNGGASTGAASMSVAPGPKLPRSVRLWVEDNGIGIDPLDLGKLFTVFQRLHDKGSYPGTGLGLAIVRIGAERMGGRAGVQSEPGKGSSFWIELKAFDERTSP